MNKHLVLSFDNEDKRNAYNYFITGLYCDSNGEVKRISRIFPSRIEFTFANKDDIAPPMRAFLEEKLNKVSDEIVYKVDNIDFISLVSVGLIVEEGEDSEDIFSMSFGNHTEVPEYTYFATFEANNHPELELLQLIFTTNGPITPNCETSAYSKIINELVNNHDTNGAELLKSLKGDIVVKTLTLLSIRNK